ncbi:MAG: hypothetical protein IJI36_15070 [Kiritimatiellae bacterium]|jgi:hypothetical protein|nr:hypothetical protein [Kiritimatiellia bacterium]
MMTRKEESNEFWMLTKGILQDARVDTDEALVIKRWLEEHQRAGEFGRVIETLGKFLTDRYIDRFESKNLCDMIGNVLTTLRQAAASEQVCQG